MRAKTILAAFESSCSGDCNQGRNCDCADSSRLDPARGILNGLALAVPAWVLVALILWWLS